MLSFKNFENNNDKKIDLGKCFFNDLMIFETMNVLG